MRRLNQFKSHSSINYICKKYGIENYIINDDFTIDVHGDVYLQLKDINYIPVIFNKVTGNFICIRSGLTSLYGSPSYVGDSFRVQENKLTSLEYGPLYVGKDYSCGHNLLTSLNGCPRKVRNFDCKYNKLITLEGCPEEVNSIDFSCSRVCTTKYYPKVVHYVSWFYNSNLPEEFEGHFSIYPDNIIEMQDEFMIWNSDNTLNEYNFKEMLKDLVPVKREKSSGMYDDEYHDCGFAENWIAPTA